MNSTTITKNVAEEYHRIGVFYIFIFLSIFKSLQNFLEYNEKYFKKTIIKILL